MTTVDNYDLAAVGQFAALGQKVEPGEFKGLEVIPLRDAWSKLSKLMFISDEVTAICPVTGQPDLYTVVIKIIPNDYSLESKSLKLYLGMFRNVGIFAEALAAEINLGIQVCKPKGSSVTVIQKSRGGITLHAQSVSGTDPGES